MTSPQGLMAGKKGLVMGIANDRSIAWGIAKSLHQHGATLGFTYQGEALEKRIRPLAQETGVKLVEPCDVTDNASMDALFARVENIRKFLILEKELDHDDGELTATQKVRRNIIGKKFAREIEVIYGGGTA